MKIFDISVTDNDQVFGLSHPQGLITEAWGGRSHRFTSVFSGVIDTTITSSFTTNESGFQIYYKGSSFPGNYNNFHIYWGDGSVDRVAGSSPNEITHYYDSTGEYVFKISGRFGGFAFPYWLDYDQIKIKTIYPPLDVYYLNSSLDSEFYNFSNCFFDARKDGSVPPQGFIQAPYVTSIKNCFRNVDMSALQYHFLNYSGAFNGCPNLEDIESAFEQVYSDVKLSSTVYRQALQNCPKIKNANRAFYNSIFSYDSNLFAYWPLLESVEYACNHAIGTSVIPESLFFNNPELKNVKGFFKYSFSPAIRIIPTGVFSNNRKLENIDSLFESRAVVTGIPSNLFANCTGLKTANSTFLGTSIERFSPNNSSPFEFLSPNVLESGSRLFYGAELTGVPSGLFNNQGSLKNLSEAFSRSKIKTLPPRLLADCTGLTNASKLCYDVQTPVPGFNDVGGPLFSGLSNLVNVEDCFLACRWGSTTSPLYTGFFYNCTGLVYADRCFADPGQSSYTYGIPLDFMEDCISLRSASRMFYQWTNLSGIHSGIFSNSLDLENIDGVFEDNDFGYIPSGLFANNTKITSASELFKDNSLLTGVPKDLLINATGITDMRNIFFNTSLTQTSLPFGLFANKPALTRVDGACALCNFTSTPSGIFDGSPAITSVATFFAANPSMEMGAAHNLLYNLPVLSNVGYLFGQTNINFIHSGFFSHNPQITNVERIFYNTPSLTGVPENLFANNPLITTVYESFLGTDFDTIPSGLFSHNPLITTVEGMLASSEITGVPENLFANNPLITNASRLFYYTDSLNTVPSGLFSHNPNITSASTMFKHCSTLTNVPANLFANNTKITSFSSCFYDCTGISGVPPDLFDAASGCTVFDFVFSNVTLETTSYSNFLFNFANSRSNDNGAFHGGNSQHGWSATGAVASLSGRGWTITDGGYDGSIPPPMSFRVDTTLVGTTNSSGFAIPTKDSATYDFTAYWGDGNNDSITGWDDAAITHQYDSTGIYAIELSGKFGRFYSNNAGDDDKILSVDGWGDGIAFESFTNAFMGCSALTGIASPITSSENVANFNNCFSSTNITSIPSGLFNYTTGVTNFWACFYNCTSLASIPNGLFDYTTEVTTFLNCFYNTNITSIPSGLFDNTTKVLQFAGCFYSAPLTSIPNGLFDYTTGATSFNNCFYNTNITSIPSGLFDNTTEVTRFDSFFQECYSLTSIPSGLFDNTTKVTNFDGCFYGTDITSIPSGLFDYMTGVTDFSYCFYDCTGLASIPSGLFDYTSGANNFSDCFYGVTLNTDSYSDLLINLEAHNLNSGVPFHGGNSQHGWSATGAVASLSGRGWTITDGGYDGSIPPPMSFRVDTTLAGTTNSSGFKIPTESTASYDFNVDWGDGQSGVITGWDDAAITHQYDSTGIYTIELGGKFGHFYANNANDDDKILSVDSWGNEIAFDTFSRAFYGCFALTGIDSPITSSENVTDFYYGFRSCSSVTSISSDLFDYATGVTGFAYCFYGCASLTSIPSGLFNNTTEVTTFFHCFDQCSNLTSIPSGLFNNTTKVTNFSDCFYYTPITSIPSGLFDYTTEVTNFIDCFSLTNITSIPNGLFDYTTKVVYVGNCFSNTPLASIPSGLFDYMTGATYFNSCFRNTSITSVPSGLFNYTSGANDFGNCFENVTLSTQSYSDLLINLEAYNLNSGVSFHGGNSQHNSSATGAVAALSGRGWTVTDGGYSGS